MKAPRAEQSSALTRGRWAEGTVNSSVCPRRLPRLPTQAAQSVAAALAALICSAGTAWGAVPAWTTYRHDAARSGIESESGSPQPPAPAWTSPTLDGKVYAEPLIYGSHVYVATENDTIYSLDTASGEIAWERHLATPVASGQLLCGDISPTVGITSTPVIDPTTKTIYAVIDTWDGTHSESIKHQLVALELGTGAVRPGFPRDVDPPFPSGSHGSPAQQLQRAALALDGNEVVIGYGGNDGDCGTYWGWLVGAPESGAGPLRSFQVDSGPGHDQGAIWGSGNAPAVDASGDIYAATGNGSSGAEYDFGDSVLKLSPTLELIESWAPEDWQHLDETDADLGSSDPVPLPDGYAFQIGKQGKGVLLRTGHLGGAGAAPAAELSVCAGSWGGGIYVPETAATGTLYTTCSGGVQAVSVSALNTLAPALSPAAGWKTTKNAVGPPIFAGGLVWVASQEDGHLYGLDPATGAVKFEDSLGTFVHFSTPSAAAGRLFAANGAHVTALRVASTPPPSPTTTALASSLDPSAPAQGVTFTATVSPVPDGGTVDFTDAGATIAGCAAVAPSEATGQASCATAYGQPAVHSIVAAYSGDPYYAGSSSAALDQVVRAPVAAGEAIQGALRLILSDLRELHRVWREGRRAALISAAGTRASARPPIGTSFTFSLNERASVTFHFTRWVSGREVDGRCVATSSRNLRRKRCARAVNAATLALSGHVGINRVALEGRIPGSRSLVRGRYRLIVDAANASGRSAPASLAFTIVG